MLRQRRQLAPELVLIPAGVFMLGLDERQAMSTAEQLGLAADGLRAEMPQQRVELPAYHISRGPVSCAEYLAFVIAADHPAPPYWQGDEPPRSLLEHPVVEVSYNDALWYCRWLSTATSREFHLPSEAEWERAARGDDQRMFPWGDLWEPGSCNIGASGLAATAPIGSYPRDTSPYGCVDMAGNVEEWTSSKYQAYPGGELTPAAGQVVARGGCWSSGIAMARCTCRHPRDPLAAQDSRGFRVVCVEDW